MRLSNEQRVAAACLSGPVRVLAGAGTGKTAVIAERFRRLVESGVDPDSVLVMTFSERAAAEMRARIVAEIGGQAEPRAVGTFHALALSWLREEGWRVGIPATFDVLAGAERWILARELMWELRLPALISAERPDDLVAPLLKLLERLKQELVPLERLETWCRSSRGDDRVEYLTDAVKLFRSLRQRSRALKLLDFDDLLVGSVRLLERQPAVRAAFARRYRHVMVDEYQDTNLAQERLVELLGSAAESVFVVGDDDQSIYRFRGASRANLERFLAGFPAARTLQLGTNRRSSGRIVAAALHLIREDTARLPKTVRAARAPGFRVELSAYGDGAGEVAAIASHVAALRGRFPLSEIAILVRTNALARPVIAALEALAVPYRLRGALGFYGRPEVNDVIALLKLLRDPDDRIALLRLAQRPPFSLDDRELEALVVAPDPYSALAAASDQARRWCAAVRELQSLVATTGVDDLFFELMERTGHLESLLAAGGADRGRVAANVSKFAELVGEYCARRSDHSLAAFLDHLELVMLSGAGEEVAEPEGSSDEAVQVMTIHQAKGLEFEAVFVPALVEGRLPQALWRDGYELPAAVLEPSIRAREDHVADERRLLYVAMTRARSRLFLSWAARYEGSRIWEPSRFVAEIARAGDAVRCSTDAGDARASRAAGAALSIQPNGRNGECPTLSFSAVAAYRECPRQYWYRHVLRLHAEQAPEAQLGTAVHGALMAAGARRREGRPVTERMLRKLYGLSWAAAGCADPRRGPALEALGWAQLKGYLSSGGLESRPHLVEHSFTTDLDGWRLRGIIDRVDPPPSQKGWGGGIRLGRNSENGGGDGSLEGRPESEAWRLIDYKTGAPVPAGRLRRDLQLSLYALGAREALGLDPLELEIVYLRTGKSVLVTADDTLLDEARRIGGEVAAGVRAGRFEARPERRRCQLCPYRLACVDAL